jgi:6-phosphogluconolactonase (cycloisomerase 2 family)
MAILSGYMPAPASDPAVPSHTKLFHNICCAGALSWARGGVPEEVVHHTERRFPRMLKFASEANLVLCHGCDCRAVVCYRRAKKTK